MMAWLPDDDIDTIKQELWQRSNHQNSTGCEGQVSHRLSVRECSPSSAVAEAR